MKQRATSRLLLLASLAGVALIMLGLPASKSAHAAAPAKNAKKEKEKDDTKTKKTAKAIEKETTRGPVTARIRLEPAHPVFGDELTLTLEVTAEKGVELMMPEFGEALDRFDILAFVPRQRVDAKGRTVATQKYTLSTPVSGKLSIPPILVEFVDRRPDAARPAPEGEDAYELLTERIDFEVKSVLPDSATADLAPPLGRLEPAPPPTKPLWPWVVGGIALLAIASPWLFRAWSHWRIRARRRSAYEIASRRLARLLQGPSPRGAEVDRFFVELSFIVRRYLEDRFELRAPELTTEEFLGLASGSPDLSHEHQRVLRDFLSRADLVKFAHVVPSAEDIELSVGIARKFLDETRENAPLIADDEMEPAPSARRGAQAAREESARV